MTLRDYDPRQNSFDTIRLLAAVLVIFSHAFPLTGLRDPLEVLSGGQSTLGHLAVCVFFLISGYLIPASLDRGSLARYVSKRSVRILPALIVAVLVCAFVLGPLVTDLPLAAYFSSDKTWQFVGNAIFLPVGFDLAGVFEGNPTSHVNGSLWSLKYDKGAMLLLEYQHGHCAAASPQLSA